MFRPALRLLLPVLVTVAVAGCGGSNSSTTDTTTSPTAINITQTFTGTLTVNGADTWPFIVTTSGAVTVTLTDVTPNGVLIGVALGTWDGTSCQLAKTSDETVEGAVIVEGVSAAANLCLRVSDTGAVTGPTDYSVQVVHP